MKHLYWVLLAMCSNMVHAADNGPAPAGVPTMGITADGQFPVYKIEEVVKGQYFIVKGQMYSNTDLLGRMVILSERDAAGGKYACNFLCRNSTGQVIGINPLFAGTIQLAMRPPVANAPVLQLAHKPESVQ